MKQFSNLRFAAVFVFFTTAIPAFSQLKEIPDSAHAAITADSTLHGAGSIAKLATPDSMRAATGADSLSSTTTGDRARVSGSPAADTGMTATVARLVTGRIMDGARQTALAGAVVTARGNPPATAIADRNGEFIIPCGTTGPCLLVVTAQGYTTDSMSVELTKDTTRLARVLLWTGANRVDKMVVIGKSEGQASAYNQEKNSANLKNVIDAELIQKLPDQSTADALQRVPGVSVQRDQGEGKYVQIRGTESRLSTVTINGQSIASPDAQTRAVALNVIPADQLATIEVNKVLTPDMDGDAIGGTVNLVTSNARDTNWRAKASFMPGYMQLSNTPIWQGSASVGKCFLDGGRLGVFVGGSYFRDEKQTEGIELDWDTSAYNPKGVAGSYLNTMQYRDYDKTNQRIGANGRIDYRFSPESNLFLVGSFNDYGMQEDRRTLGLDIVDQDARPMADNKDIVGEVPTTRSIKDTYKEQMISSATLGGAAKLLNLSLDGNLAYSFANSSEPHEMTVSFARNNLSYIFNHSNADRPTFEPIMIILYQTDDSLASDSTNFNNSSKYPMASAKIENTQSTENSVSGQCNAKMPFEFDFGGIEAKAGVKVLEHIKNQTLREITYHDTGRYTEPNLSSFVGGYSNSDFYNGLFDMRTMPDPGLVRAYLSVPHYYNNVVNPGNRLVADSTTNHLDVDPETFAAKDFNGAGYLMGTLYAGNWTGIGGVRCEYTSMHYSGYSDTVSNENKWLSTSTFEMYKNFFFPLPYLIVKYALNKETNLRASYTRSFSRPDWFDLVPHIVYNVDDNVYTAIAGNPNLRPTTSDNLDLSCEYYSKDKKNVAYAGLFYKQMHDYIFSSETDSFFNQAKTNWAYFTKLNGDKANLAGLEVEYLTQLSFLPTFLSGIGVNANYIYTWSKTLLPGLNLWTALPGQAEHVGNIALFYEKYGFYARAALNYQSHCIVSLINTKDNFASTCVDDHLQLDCAASQRITKNITAVIEFNNITNAPKKIYLGDPQHTTQMEYYGWGGQFGVRWSL